MNYKNLFDSESKLMRGKQKDGKFAPKFSPLKWGCLLYTSRTQLADEFYKRSQNYRNVFNPASSFMQPIDDQGIFQPNFSPDDYTAHICESNGWQYFWSVQQDIKGLIALTGSKDRFTEKLDSMFTYRCV